MNNSPILRVVFSIFVIFWIGSFLLYRAASSLLRRLEEDLRLLRHHDLTLERNSR